MNWVEMSDDPVLWRMNERVYEIYYCDFEDMVSCGHQQVLILHTLFASFRSSQHILLDTVDRVLTTFATSPSSPSLSSASLHPPVPVLWFLKSCNVHFHAFSPSTCFRQVDLFGYISVCANSLCGCLVVFVVCCAIVTSVSVWNLSIVDSITSEDESEFGRYTWSRFVSFPGALADQQFIWFIIMRAWICTWTLQLQWSRSMPSSSSSAHLDWHSFSLRTFDSPWLAGVQAPHLLAPMWTQTLIIILHPYRIFFELLDANIFLGKVWFELLWVGLYGLMYLGECNWTLSNESPFFPSCDVWNKSPRKLQYYV